MKQYQFFLGEVASKGDDAVAAVLPTVYGEYAKTLSSEQLLLCSRNDVYTSSGWRQNWSSLGTLIFVRLMELSAYALVSSTKY